LAPAGKFSITFFFSGRPPETPPLYENLVPSFGSNRVEGIPLLVSPPQAANITARDTRPPVQATAEGQARGEEVAVPLAGGAVEEADARQRPRPGPGDDVGVA